MVQQVAHIAPKRSYAEFSSVYVLSPKISSSGVDRMESQPQWNPVPTNSVFPNNLTDEQYLNHDRIGRLSLLDVGASASYGITRKTNLFAGWGRSIKGANTHLRSLVLTVGVTKSFTARSREEKKSVRALRGIEEGAGLHLREVEITQQD